MNKHIINFLVKTSWTSNKAIFLKGKYVNGGTLEQKWLTITGI